VPIPSPDGKLVAYVRTGWRGAFISGFGRSSLVFVVTIANTDGKIVSQAEISSFLGAWLPDSSAVICYRDGQFGLANQDGWHQQGVMPDISDPSNKFAEAERVTFLSPLQRFVWLDLRESKTLLQTPRGPIGEIDSHLPSSDLIVPSPDGHYLAIASTAAGKWFSPFRI
jgi:hypothetical protein